MMMIATSGAASYTLTGLTQGSGSSQEKVTAKKSCPFSLCTHTQAFARIAVPANPIVSLISFIGNTNWGPQFVPARSHPPPSAALPRPPHGTSDPLSHSP